MIKMKVVPSPTLLGGVFTVPMDEGASIKNEGPTSGVRTTTAAGAVVIPLWSVTGFAVGQSVLIKDTAGNSETRIITIVTTGATPSIQVTVALANTYTVANGATVTVISPRVAVEIGNYLPRLVSTTEALVAQWGVAPSVAVTGTISGGGLTVGEVVTGTVSGATGIVLTSGAGAGATATIAGLTGVFSALDTINGAAQTITAISAIVTTPPATTTVTIIVDTVKQGGGGNLVLAAAVTADLAGAVVTVLADED